MGARLRRFVHRPQSDSGAFSRALLPGSPTSSPSLCSAACKAAARGSEHRRPSSSPPPGNCDNPERSGLSAAVVWASTRPQRSLHLLCSNRFRKKSSARQTSLRLIDLHEMPREESSDQEDDLLCCWTAHSYSTSIHPNAVQRTARSSACESALS